MLVRMAPKITPHYLLKIPLSISQKYPSLSTKNTPQYTPKIPLIICQKYPQYTPKIPLSNPKIHLIIYQKYPSVYHKNTLQYTTQYPSLSPKNTFRIPVDSYIYPIFFDWILFSVWVAFPWVAKKYVFLGCQNTLSNTSEYFSFLSKKYHRIRDIFGSKNTPDSGYFWKIPLGVFLALPNGEAINAPEG